MQRATAGENGTGSREGLRTRTLQQSVTTHKHVVTEDVTLPDHA